MLKKLNIGVGDAISFAVLLYPLFVGLELLQKDLVRWLLMLLR